LAILIAAVTYFAEEFGPHDPATWKLGGTDVTVEDLAELQQWLSRCEVRYLNQPVDTLTLQPQDRTSIPVLVDRSNG